MIILDGQKLDLKNPSTEAEKLAAARFQELIKEYKLDEGKRIHFVYPKKYEVPNRHDPTKIDRPRAFRIKYSCTLSTPTGTESWVYAKSIGRDKKGAPRYNPPSRRFTGDLYLGIRDIDEIFFLIDKYPRTESGKASSNLPKFIAIHDVEVEARTDIAENRSRIVIESMLYLEESKGGLSERDIRNLALKLRLPGHDTKATVILRTELRKVLMTMQGGAGVLDEYVSSKSDKAVSKTVNEISSDYNVLKAEASGVIEFYKVAGHTGWRWLKSGKPDGKIMSVKNEDTRYEELVVFLTENEEDAKKFLSLM